MRHLVPAVHALDYSSLPLLPVVYGDSSELLVVGMCEQLVEAQRDRHGVCFLCSVNPVPLQEMKNTIRRRAVAFCFILQSMPEGSGGRVYSTHHHQGARCFHCCCGRQADVAAERLSVLSDEVAPDLGGAIRFAKDFNLRWLELRGQGANKRNYYHAPLAEVRQSATMLKDAGIGVSFLNTRFLNFTIQERSRRPFSPPLMSAHPRVFDPAPSRLLGASSRPG